MAFMKKPGISIELSFFLSFLSPCYTDSLYESSLSVLRIGCIICNYFNVINRFFGSVVCYFPRNIQWKPSTEEFCVQLVAISFLRFHNEFHCCLKGICFSAICVYTLRSRLGFWCLITELCIKMGIPNIFLKEKAWGSYL